jgi:hypothetical protein
MYKPKIEANLIDRTNIEDVRRKMTDVVYIQLPSFTLQTIEPINWLIKNQAPASDH